MILFKNIAFISYLSIEIKIIIMLERVIQLEGENEGGSTVSLLQY